MVSISSNEGDEESSKQPWWINPVYKFGIPSAICIFLVWFLTTQVKSDLNDLKLSMNNLNSQVSFNKNLIETNTQVNERMLQVLQRICINSAATNFERNECFK